jgi:hypothetical protein
MGTSHHTARRTPVYPLGGSLPQRVKMDTDSEMAKELPVERCRNGQPSRGLWKSVRCSDIEWKVFVRIANEEFGMTAGQFLGVLVRNWERKRWPLELQ